MERIGAVEKTGERVETKKEERCHKGRRMKGK